MHCITLHSIALHCIALYCNTLHYIRLHGNSLDIFLVVIFSYETLSPHILWLKRQFREISTDLYHSANSHIKKRFSISVFDFFNCKLLLEILFHRKELRSTIKIKARHLLTIHFFGTSYECRAFKLEVYH